MNNTTNHISDKALTVVFDPSGTNWPADYTNVQKCLQDMGAWVRNDPGLPNANEVTQGIIRIATTEEAVAGTDQSTAITPFTLNTVLRKPEATETLYGTTRYAKDTERMDETNNVTSITPLGLNYVFNQRIATETKTGVAMVATEQQAKTATQDNVMMTPRKVKIAIETHVKPVATATESTMGISKMATVAEIQTGAAREGVAISPYGFAQARGTSTAYGTFKAADNASMTTLTATDMAVTPKSLGDNKGDIGNKYGIVALSNTVRSGLPNTALSANAAVLPSTGGEMTGTIVFNRTGDGVRWNFATDSAWITFQSTGDGDPDTRMEFAVADNSTEYFRWISNGTAGTGVEELMRLSPVGNNFLDVNGDIRERGARVYSPNNRPNAWDVGAIPNTWGGVQLTGYLNAMDAPIDYVVPDRHVMVGLQSYHSNKTEDRQWRVYHRRIG